MGLPLGAEFPMWQRAKILWNFREGYTCEPARGGQRFVKRIGTFGFLYVCPFTSREFAY